MVKLVVENDIKSDQIEKVVISAGSNILNPIRYPIASNHLEAKFSLRLATAMGLAGVDTSRLSTYSEEVAADPTLIAMRDRIELDFRTGIPNTFAEIELTLNDGSKVTARHDAGIPAADTAEQGRRLEEKFASLVEPVLGGNSANALIAEIAKLEAQPDVRGIMALCAG